MRAQWKWKKWVTIWMSPEPPHGLNRGGSNGRTDHLFAALTLAGYNIRNLDGSRSVFNGRTTLSPGAPEALRFRPTTRCFFDLRHRQLQQRFRSRPGSLRPADVEGVVATMSCQVRRKEITLSLDTTVANMVTFPPAFSALRVSSLMNIPGGGPSRCGRSSSGTIYMILSQF